jgi:hypothetical protein
MLGAGIYPITIAEMQNYTREADQYLDFEEHESLKTFLALHPESGDVLPGTGGVRVQQWPIKKQPGRQAKIVYFFRDLNMPLYMLALYKKGERIPLDFDWKDEIKGLVDELVAQHSERWALVIRQQRGGSELA